MRPHMNRYRHAFSLIELMIVIVIMAVLAAIIIPKFQDQSRRSREAALKSNLSQVRTAISTFQADTGFYPHVITDLAATSAPSQGYDSTATLQSITASDWHGPYVTGVVPNDPISGSAFTYTTSAPGVGAVASSATGNDLSGTAYSTY
jgi:general secretion pathway protein G